MLIPASVTNIGLGRKESLTTTNVYTFSPTATCYGRVHNFSCLYFFSTSTSSMCIVLPSMMACVYSFVCVLLSTATSSMYTSSLYGGVCILSHVHFFYPTATSPLKYFGTHESTAVPSRYFRNLVIQVLRKKTRNPREGRARPPRVPGGCPTQPGDAREGQSCRPAVNPP